MLPIPMIFSGGSGPVPDPEPMIIQIDTTIDDGLSLTGYTFFVMGPDTPYDITIDWGDGTVEDKTITYTGFWHHGQYISHNYLTEGVYDISITNLKSFIGYGAQKVVDVLQWGETPFAGLAFELASFTTLSASDIPIFATGFSRHSGQSGGIFYDCPSFISGNLNSWDVSNITDMSYMFSSSFNDDISSWNVSNVTNMSYMFTSCTSFNSDLSSWNVSSATNMNSMFSSCTIFNSDLSSWDVSNVTNMNFMFLSATSFNSDLSSWCVTLIPTEPSNFAYNTPAWDKVDRVPVWGTCP